MPRKSASAPWRYSRCDVLVNSERIEAGQLQVELRPVAVGELLDSTLHLCETQAQRHGVTLHAAYREQAGITASSDPVRLRQVMLNLLSNAIKYNRRGGRVRVEASRDGDRVRLDVSDNGLGMTTAQLARLFEPFNRLGREHGEIEGTGIGLALTRELVQQPQPHDRPRRRAPLHFGETRGVEHRQQTGAELTRTHLALRLPRIRYACEAFGHRTGHPPDIGPTDKVDGDPACSTCSKSWCIRIRMRCRRRRRSRSSHSCGTAPAACGRTWPR